MNINNSNYSFLLNHVEKNITPTFKGEIEDEDFKKRFETIFQTRYDLNRDRSTYEKIVNPDNISVFEALSLQKKQSGYSRFSTYEIDNIMKSANKDTSSTILKIINMKDDNDYAFQSYNLSNSFTFLNADNCAFVDKLTTSFPKIIKDGCLDKILNYSNQMDFNIFFKIAEMKSKDVHLFSSYDLASIAPYCNRKNEKIINTFLSNFNAENDTSLNLFSLSQMLASSNDFQKDFAVELMKKKNSQGKTAFSIYSISKIIQSYNQENAQNIRKIIDLKNSDGENIFSEYALAQLADVGFLTKYSDIIIGLANQDLNSPAENLIAYHIQNAVGSAYEKIEYEPRLEKCIEVIGRENIEKISLSDLDSFFDKEKLSDEDFELVLKNLKVVKENTSKQLWDEIQSLSTVGIQEVLEPSKISKTMKKLETLPENFRKRLNNIILNYLFVTVQNANEMQMSQEAINYLQQIDDKLLNEIGNNEIFSLIFLPEDSVFIKEGMDYLTSLDSSLLEMYKSKIPSIMKFPIDAEEEGIKFNPNKATEFLTILGENMNPEILKDMSDFDFKKGLVAYLKDNSKETLLRNINFINHFYDNNNQKYNLRTSQFIGAEKEIDLFSNYEIAKEVTSKENLEKLIKKYKGSNLETTLRNLFSLDSNQETARIPLTSLITQKDLSAKTFEKSFEDFAKITKMINRELEKKDEKTGEISFNFLNGQFTSEKQAKQELNFFLLNSFDEIIKALSIIDIGTANNLLNKRISNFIAQIRTINSLPIKDADILRKLTKECGILNSQGKVINIPDRDKIDFITIIISNRKLIANGGEGINFEDYLKDTTGYPVENKNIKKIIDINILKSDILEKALLSSGLSKQELDNIQMNNLKWDKDYLHLLCSKPYRDKGELATVIKESTLGRFNDFITNKSNEYGVANANTENAFYNAGINFAVWDKQQVQDLKVTSKIGGENINIELWNRNPQESLFDGNYTTCCTALDRSNGASMARYLLNKAFNVVEMKNDKGKTFAMSRIYMANVDNKPSLIMENIEINNNWLSTLSNEDKKQLKDSISEYMKKLTSELSENEIPIYFSTSYNKLEELWKKENTTVSKEIEFIGDISPKDVYMNTFKGYTIPVGKKAESQFYEIK